MSRTYGQFCGLARALEMVGERWAMLVVRDLLLSPKRFTQLRRGLPKMPPSILAARLNELEEAGVVRRRVTAELDASIVYELTEYGADLEPIVLQLALWGARSLETPAGDELFTLDAAILSLYTTFRPDRAVGVHALFELRFGLEMCLRADVHDGTLEVTEISDVDEPVEGEVDLVIRPRGPMKPIMAGEVTAQEAVDRGMVDILGDIAMLELYASLFHVPAAPRRDSGLTSWETPMAIGLG